MIEFERRSGVLIARLKVGAVLAPDMVEKIVGATRTEIDRQGALRAVIDLTHTETISSAMIGGMVALKKHLMEKGGDLRLCNLNDRLSAVAFVTRLADVIPYSRTLGDALASFGPTSAEGPGKT